MQFSRQLSGFPLAALLCAVPGAGLAALFASGGSPGSLGLLAAGLAVGLIGLTALPRHWKTVGPIEKYTDASSGSAEVPSLASTVLFFLILTGPPRLRVRSDPMASIRGDVDAVVVFQIVVWALAGMWVLHELWQYRSRLGAPMRLRLPQGLGILLVFCLGLSAFVSEAPLLTLFEVYQLGVMLLLGFLFVRRYGPRACLQRLFWGYTVLLIAAGILALCAPDAAFQPMPSGGLRLWANLIVDGVGQVAALAIILLLTIAPRLPRMLYLSLLALDVAILVVSYTRSAYLCVFAFLALALVKRTQSVAPRRVAYLLLAAIPVLLATGLLPRVVLLVVRESETLGTLTGRTGLWAYLADVTFSKSPWIGLGYYSAARIYGAQYGTWSVSPHSSFVQVLVGGGLLSLGVFALLWSVLLFRATSLLLRTTDRYAFAACSLLISVFVVSQVGEGMEPGPRGFTFWCLVTIVPWMRDRLASSRNPTACRAARRGILISSKR
jgi:O-antigen ligase